MYIHVGEDVMVRTDEIVAIIDKDTVQFSDEIQLFLKKKEKQTSNLAKVHINLLWSPPATCIFHHWHRPH